MSTGEICGVHLLLPQPSSFFTGAPQAREGCSSPRRTGLWPGEPGKGPAETSQQWAPPKMPSDPFLTQIPLPRAVPREMRAAERGGLALQS